LYDLHIDNDLFNSKTFIIIIYIFSIIFYIFAFTTLISAFDDDTFSNKETSIFSRINNAYNSNIIIALLSILTLVYFITIIAIRFDGGDENGYKKLYGYNINIDTNPYTKYALEVNFYTLIAVLIFIKIGLLSYINKDKLEPGIAIYLIFVAAFYIFTLYFMKNILNIVLSFRNNEYPLNKNGNDDIVELDKYYKDQTNGINYYNNVDISYGSENYFYRKYLEYSKLPYFDIFKDLHDINKLGYNNATTYNISNLKDNISGDSKAIYNGNIRVFLLVIIIIMTCAVLLYGLISFIAWGIDKSIGTNYLKFNYERIKNYAILIVSNIILPLFILFIIIFVIIATMEYNTMVNKDILIDINKKYKEDLNDLNNSLLPVLYTKDKELVDDKAAIKYSYVIYNVMSSYIINTINIFQKSTNSSHLIKYEGDKKIVRIESTIKDTSSPYEKDDKYNINVVNYNNNYNDILETTIKSISITDVNNYNIDSFNNYVSTIDEFTRYTDQTDIIKYYNKIFNKEKLDNLDYIKINMKNNILCSMYNIDNYNGKTGDDKEYYFRNYIFKKQVPVTNIYFNEFLLKANLEDIGIDFNKYKIYYSYIDKIIDDFLAKLLVLHKRIPEYDIIKNSNDSVKKEEYEKAIIGAFKDLKENFKDTLNDMINDFTSLNDESNNILFRDIEVNYNRINNKDNKVEFKAFNLSDDKFKSPEIINNEFTVFNNKSTTDIKKHKDEIDLLKDHDNIVKNANFVINERLYVLISTYLISLFIAYKLVKN
jgi:hypothetical protein